MRSHPTRKRTQFHRRTFSVDAVFTYVGFSLWLHGMFFLEPLDTGRLEGALLSSATCQVYSRSETRMAISVGAWDMGWEGVFLKGALWVREWTAFLASRMGGLGWSNPSS